MEMSGAKSNPAAYRLLELCYTVLPSIDLLSIEIELQKSARHGFSAFKDLEQNLLFVFVLAAATGCGFLFGGLHHASFFCYEKCCHGARQF